MTLLGKWRTIAGEQSSDGLFVFHQKKVYKEPQMIVRTLSRVKALLLIAGIAVLAGCAANAQTEQTQSDVQRALEMAEQAQQTAQQALETAQSAQQAAEQSERCCQEQQQRLDRAIERMQQK